MRERWQQCVERSFPARRAMYAAPTKKIPIMHLTQTSRPDPLKIIPSPPKPNLTNHPTTHPTLHLTFTFPTFLIIFITIIGAKSMKIFGVFYNSRILTW